MWGGGVFTEVGGAETRQDNSSNLSDSLTEYHHLENTIGGQRTSGKKSVHPRSSFARSLVV